LATRCDARFHRTDTVWPRVGVGRHCYAVAQAAARVVGPRSRWHWRWVTKAVSPASHVTPGRRRCGGREISSPRVGKLLRRVRSFPSTMQGVHLRPSIGWPASCKTPGSCSGIFPLGRSHLHWGCVGLSNMLSNMIVRVYSMLRIPSGTAYPPGLQVRPCSASRYRLRTS